MAMQIEEAIEKYGSLVIHIAWRITRDEEATKDISQEVFMKLHTAWADGKEIDARIKSWLGKTTLNAALNTRRQNARLVPFDEDQSPLCTEGGIADTDRTLLLDKIHQLIPSLPERQQEVFILRHFEGLPFDAIAQTVGCSPLAARSAAFQALKKIRAWLTSEPVPEKKVPPKSEVDSNAFKK